jgi:hypothetical protein
MAAGGKRRDAHSCLRLSHQRHCLNGSDDRHDLHFISCRIGLSSRVDDQTPFRPNIVGADVEPPFDLRCSGTFDFYRESRTSAPLDHQVDLGTIGRTVKARDRMRTSGIDQRLDDEAFPTRAPHRMAEKLVGVAMSSRP